MRIKKWIIFPRSSFEFYIIEERKDFQENKQKRIDSRKEAKQKELRIFNDQWDHEKTFCKSPEEYEEYEKRRNSGLKKFNKGLSKQEKAFNSYLKEKAKAFKTWEDSQFEQEKNQEWSYQIGFQAYWEKLQNEKTEKTLPTDNAQPQVREKVDYKAQREAKKAERKRLELEKNQRKQEERAQRLQREAKEREATAQAVAIAEDKKQVFDKLLKNKNMNIFNKTFGKKNLEQKEQKVSMENLKTLLDKIRRFPIERYFCKLFQQPTGNVKYTCDKPPHVFFKQKAYEDFLLLTGIAYEEVAWICRVSRDEETPEHFTIEEVMLLEQKTSYGDVLVGDKEISNALYPLLLQGEEVFDSWNHCQVHSHHNLSTDPSGVDKDALQKRNNMDYFIRIIVNKKGSMNITIKANPFGFTCENVPFTVLKETTVKAPTQIAISDGAILPIQTVSPGFAKRFEEISNEMEAKITTSSDPANFVPDKRFLKLNEVGIETQETEIPIESESSDQTEETEPKGSDV
ncbi:hypothetical protein FACS1894176_02590 [Bacteroidia bacterium]|nr:hypothetical protein FACS1894176_02590 [Bacteroidia bacterium]